MSCIAGLYNIPATPEQLATWATVHASQHRDVNRVIYERAGIRPVEFVIDPIDVQDTGAWAYQHQVMHDAINDIVGGGGFRLNTVDWTDQALLAGWIFLNATEHRNWADVLGIS